jgi:anti-sigma B factor antagonist
MLRGVHPATTPSADAFVQWRGESALTEEPLLPSGIVIKASGELDIATAPGLRDRLNAAIESGVTRIVVDLSEVVFVDSLSLASIVGAQTRLAERGRLAVAANHPYVLLIFEAGGLDSVLTLFETPEQATAFVQAS